MFFRLLFSGFLIGVPCLSGILFGQDIVGIPWTGEKGIAKTTQKSCNKNWRLPFSGQPIMSGHHLNLMQTVKDPSESAFTECIAMASAIFLTNAAGSYFFRSESSNIRIEFYHRITVRYLRVSTG